MLVTLLWIAHNHGVNSPSGNPPKHTNQLIHEKSPYLLQHAHNPVDWYPWGEKAFTKSRRENKPIFLSIGYSTCHWCHVMERESFENPSIAELLNQKFVSIKVDREERPDLDQIYMAATQAMSGSGGWPMSVFLNLDGEPFYAGTYFPPEDRYGRPGFPRILNELSRLWQEDPQQLQKASSSLVAALKEMLQGATTSTEWDRKLPDETFRYFERNFDSVHGGFGGAPKFPRPVQYEFLFRYSYLTQNATAREMVLKSLQNMARGGIYDHLGGGFSRYSVDEEWRVPHFEKMLYDNAQLLKVYIEAWQITGDSFHKNVAADLVRYLSRDMTHSGGAFFSAEDADSEGEEGTFYVWTMDEVEKILGDKDARIFAFHHDFKPGGNFEHGKNVLHPSGTVEKTASEFGLSVPEVTNILERSRLKLFDARTQRPRPHLDDKILTSWNGLMIASLAYAGRVAAEPDWVELAKRAATFLLSHLKDSTEGTLIHRWRDEEARGLAFLDDYAFLIDGLLELFLTTGDESWLKEARRLTAEQEKRLGDPVRGGFFDAGSEDASLLVRPKSAYEGAEPSGNSVAMQNYLHLYSLTGEEAYRKQAEKILGSLLGQVSKTPASMPFLVSLGMEYQASSVQLVLAGDPTQPDVQELWKQILRRYQPDTVCLQSPGNPHSGSTVPMLKDKISVKGEPTLYLCKDFVCKQPLVGKDAIQHWLANQPDSKE